MAVIKPSLNFDGSDLTTNNISSIIRSNVPAIDFKSEKAKSGLYLFILPPYKVDTNGNGVWFRVVTVRDNFGLDIKEKFPVQKGCPVEYFANKVKILFPEYGATQKMVRDGKDIKQYPSFGRVTKRVLFNAAYYDSLDKGAHVLDIPQSGCAEVIDNFHRRVGPSGKLTQMVSDPTAAVPIFFRLKPPAETKGNPWEVIIRDNERSGLPEQLADSEYLHNLDDVLVKKNPDELIEKLRLYTPVEIFEACMRGYVRDGGLVPKPVAVKVNVPFAGAKETGPVAYTTDGGSKGAPALNVPALGKLNIPKVISKPTAPAEVVEQEVVTAHPMSEQPQTREQIEGWLRKKA